MVPDESPEVSHGVRERTLCCDVLIATIVTLRIWRESVCEGGVCDGKNLVICTQCRAHDDI